MYEDEEYSDRPQREMFTVTCAECGIETEVPFKPDGTRPVYCQDCFQKRKPARSFGFGGGGGGGRGGGRGGGGGGQGRSREMHSVICAECGMETEVPFKPDGSRPVYCRDCYSKHKPNRF